MGANPNDTEPGVDGRKFVIVFLLVTAAIWALFLVFKPERPVGGPTNFVPPIDNTLEPVPRGEDG